MKRQGKRTDLTSAPLGQKLKGKTSREILAAASPYSHSQIQRFIRITELIPEILQMVDDGKIALRPAVEISYLTENEQRYLQDTMFSEDCTSSHVQVIKMRQFSQEKRLNPDVILSIMQEEKPNQKEKIIFKADRIRQYIPKNLSPNQTEDYVIKALEHYQRFRERQRAQER